MAADKINGYRAPYRSQTFQSQADAQTGRNGVLDMDGSVSEESGIVTIPRFTFIQDGLIVDTESARTIPSPTLTAPYYLVVSAPTPADTDDLLVTFAKTPLDLSANDIIVAAWDGLEWRSPQFLSTDGIYNDIDQANIDFNRVGPFSGLQTTLVGPNYENSPGVIVDPVGLRQALLDTAVFPTVVTDPDLSRVDRVIYRRPADSPNRIGLRQFALGGTYDTVPTTVSTGTPFNALQVRNKTKVLIASDNSAIVLNATGHNGTYHVYFTKIASNRVTITVAEFLIENMGQIGFDAALDGSDNLHLVFIRNDFVYHRKFGSTGTALTAAVRIDTQATPSLAPTISIDPDNTKVYVAYQSLLGASNNQIFFTTRNLSGALVTAPMNITGNLSNLQNPSIFATDDLFVYIAWEDTTFGKIYYRTFDDVGVPIDAAANYVSANVDRIGFSPLTDGASQPKIWVADNKSVFVSFLQDKSGAVLGVSIWNDGAAYMRTLLSAGEDFTAYDMYVDSTFNGVHLIVASATAVDYAKLDGQDLGFALNLSGGGSNYVATVRDRLGSMFHAWAALSGGGFQVAYQTAHIAHIGPAVVANGPNSYSLDSFQFMIQSSLFGLQQPVAGDRVTVTGSLAGNNGVYIIDELALVTLVSANDYYLVTVLAAFPAAETPTPVGLLGAFAAPNGNAVRSVKSTSETVATAFQLLHLDTDILLARISMPGSNIVNYLPPGVTVALDSALFVPHGNDVHVDWGATTPGSLTIAGGLKLLDMLHDQDYDLVDSSLPMVNGEALYVVCDGVNFTPTPVVTAVNTLPFSTPIIVLGIVKDGKFNPAQLAMAAVTQLDVGEEDVVGEDLPLTQRERLGIIDDTSYDPYGSTLVVNETMSHPEAIGTLDGVVGAFLANQPAEAYWNGDGSSVIFDIGTATILGTPFTWSTDNTKPDIIVDVDGRKQPLDATGTNGYRKLSTTTFRLAAAPDGGAAPSLITVRREGTSYGGPTPPPLGNLWSDQVDADILPPHDAFSVGSATQAMKAVYTCQMGYTAPIGAVNPVSALKKVKYKKNVSGATIPAGIVSVYSDGSMYRGAGSTTQGRRMIGLLLADCANGFFGPVYLEGINVPGVLALMGFTPGTEIYIDDSGNYSDGTTGISGSADTVEFVGIADCADNVISAVATDLIFFLQKVAENA